MALAPAESSVIIELDPSQGTTESDDLSRVIAAIYDAALDPQLWPSVLEQVCGFVGGYGASLFIHDAAAKNADFLCQWGVDSEAWAAYNSTYVKINPAFPTLLLKETGTVLANVDIVPEARLRLTRFYKEWLHPQGFVDTVGTILEKSLTSCAAFAVLRGAEHGIVDAQTRRRMALLVPHLQRAVLIGKTIELKNMANDNFVATLDALTTGVFLLSDARAILHANRSGAHLRADDTLLTASGRVFQARDPATDAQFRAIFSASSTATAALARKSAVVEMAAAEGTPYVAHVLPLGSGRRVRSYHGASFAVFVHRSAMWRPTVVESVAERFNLTRAEVRVLFAIVELGGIPEIAPILGVSQATVKTHLKSIFRKTNTARQVDLVKLVAAFAGQPVL